MAIGFADPFPLCRAARVSGVGNVVGKVDVFALAVIIGLSLAVNEIKVQIIRKVDAFKIDALKRFFMPCGTADFFPFGHVVLEIPGDGLLDLKGQIFPCKGTRLGFPYGKRRCFCPQDRTHFEPERGRHGADREPGAHVFVDIGRVIAFIMQSGDRITFVDSGAPRIRARL